MSILYLVVYYNSTEYQFNNFMPVGKEFQNVVTNLYGKWRKLVMQLFNWKTIFFLYIFCKILRLQ